MKGRSSRWRVLTLGLAALVAIPLHALAAPLRPKSDHADAKKEQTSAPDASEATPYEPDLLRLSEIIGALAYLRNLCGAQDGDRWRAKMSALLAAEGGSQIQREQLAGAYNKGFRDYELIYHSCTANAHTVISRYLAEGSKLTRDVTSRYGGG